MDTSARSILLLVLTPALGLGAAVAGGDAVTGTECASSALRLCGVSYTAWSAVAYGSTRSDASLGRIRDTGANYVAILVTQYVKGKTANMVFLDPVRTPSDASLVHAIRTAHGYGIKVLLKPHVDPQDGTWRGELAPADVDLWFASYTDFIVHYAKIAQETNVELFCVGTELRSLSGAKYRRHWENVVAAVRSFYSGPIVYAANWDEYQMVAFWDLVDYVGIDAYFPLSGQRTPSVDDLVRGWAVWATSIEAWQRGVGKPILFTEIGYRSIDFPARTPWEWSSEGRYNGQAQANCYEAVFRTFVGRPWFVGMFWWNWTTNPDGGGPGDVDYTPQNKPAQEVLARRYAGGCCASPVGAAQRCELACPVRFPNDRGFAYGNEGRSCLGRGSLDPVVTAVPEGVRSEGNEMSRGTKR